MVILGVCGTSGSGKSTVSSIFKSFGAAVLDCDQIYHRLTSSNSPCLKALAAEFGKEIVQNNALDRKKLAAIVYHDPAKRQRLNEISHFYVKKKLLQRIGSLRKKGASACVIDAPLLFEAGLEEWCDAVIGVTASREVKIKRISERDQISPEEAALRLSAQIPDEELRSRCTDWIVNDSDLVRLRLLCLSVYSRYVN